MTAEKLKEKKKLKVARSSYSSIKKNHPNLFSDLRDETIRAFVKAKTPNWGGLRFSITANGL